MFEDLDLQFDPHNKEIKKCGCYINNEELARQHSGKNILAPLIASDYHIEIVNAMANVNLTQEYHNPTGQFLEMEYHFPINPDACVYKFVAVFGKMRIEGVVKEKEEAKKEYQQAVKGGKKAAYGEINSESKDILTLKIGNIPPKEMVRIQITYLQELTLSCNTFYQLHMSGTISPRYMNYIPKKLVEKGFKKDSGHKVKGEFSWNFRISLKTTRRQIFAKSHTHELDNVKKNRTATEAELMLTKAGVPNKDFTFTYTTENFHLPSFVFGRTDAGSSAMLSFIPKFCDLSIDDAYKASLQNKKVETQIDKAKGEFIFLLDRSGSMGGSRIRKAKQALILFVQSLPEDSYFNVVSFGSNSEQMSESSMRYTNKQVEKAVNKIKQMNANLGGTQIYFPLEKLLTKKPLEGYPKQIFLLTDGCVSNTTEVVTMVGINNKFARVHTIGIGNGCSQELIVGCAKKGKGQHVFIGDHEDPSQKIIQLLSDSLSPVISKMQLDFDKSIVESIIPNPQSLPYILKNQLVNFYVCFKGQLQKPAHFGFSYEDSSNGKQFSSGIVIDPVVQGEYFVDKMGHFKKIRLLEDSHKQGTSIEDMMYYVKKVDKKTEIISESVKHQILSDFTAFLCVEKELVDGKYQEVRDKGQVKVEVSSPQPVEIGDNLNRKSLKMKASHQKAKRRRQEQIDLRRKVLQDKKYQLQQAQMDMQTIDALDSVSQHISLAESYNQKLCPIEVNQKSNKQIAQRLNKLMLDQKSDDDDADTMLNELNCEINMNKCKNIVETTKKNQYKQDDIEEMLKNLTVERSIDKIVACQSTDGSWSDLSLIGQLYLHSLEKKVAKAKHMLVVITYLVAKWIEKKYPQKQYGLVVKKGLKFVDKNAENYGELTKEYRQYIQ